MTQLEIDAEINGLKNLLAQTDYQALKFADGSLSEEEYAPAKAERQSFRDRINELQAMTPEDESPAMDVVEE